MNPFTVDLANIAGLGLDPRWTLRVFDVGLTNTVVYRLTRMNDDGGTGACAEYSFTREALAASTRDTVLVALHNWVLAVTAPPVLVLDDTVTPPMNGPDPAPARGVRHIDLDDDATGSGDTSPPRK